VARRAMFHAMAGMLQADDDTDWTMGIEEEDTGMGH
jgi:hypothetical protein